MKRKVGFVCMHESLSGVLQSKEGNDLVNISNKLIGQGFEVDIFCPADNEIPQQIEEVGEGIRVVYISSVDKSEYPFDDHLKYLEELASGIILFMQCEQQPYDLLHAYSWDSGFVSLLIKNISNIPYIISFEGLAKVQHHADGHYEGHSFEKMHTEEIVLKEADIIIASTMQTKEDLINHYFVDEQKIRVVSCAIDQTEYHPVNKYKAKSGLGLQTSEMYVLHTGHLVDNHNVNTIIQGIAYFIKQAKVPVRLLFVDKYSEAADLFYYSSIEKVKKTAQELGITDRISFVHGIQKDQLKFYYSAADVVVNYPTADNIDESISLEAMACGTPFIGSDTGNDKHTIEDGKTGYIVPENDPEVLSKRLTDLFSNDFVKRQLSANSLKRVHELFARDKVEAIMTNIYCDFANKNETDTAQF